MKIKISFFLILAYSSIIYGNTDSTYKIIDGPFKNSTVTIKNTLLINKENVEKVEIYHILLKRIADLKLEEKNEVINIIKSLPNQTLTKDKNVLLKTLPESLKKGFVCLCLMSNQECYIDQRFLIKNDK